LRRFNSEALILVDPEVVWEYSNRAGRVQVEFGISVASLRREKARVAVTVSAQDLEDFNTVGSG
jgi:hypothetical protein